MYTFTHKHPKKKKKSNLSCVYKRWGPAPADDIVYQKKKKV